MPLREQATHNTVSVRGLLREGGRTRRAKERKAVLEWGHKAGRQTDR